MELPNTHTKNECPKQSLGLAIFSAIMFPTGIVAIVKTALVKMRWNQGRYDDAYKLARSARRYAITSIIIGAILVVIYVVYYIALLALIASTY